MAEPNRKYTVHLDITELERGTKMSAKDSEMTGLWVRGMTSKDGTPESWEKFLMDWNAAEYIEKIEGAGVGAKIDIVMEKEGRFWNIKGVYSKGKASTPPASTPVTDTQTGLPENGKVEAPKQQEMFQPGPIIAGPLSGEFTPVVHLKKIALDQAVDLTTSMMEVGIIKAAKSSPTVVVEGVLILANTLMTYLEGENSSEPKSDVSPLAPVDGEGAPGVGDDDIPF